MSYMRLLPVAVAAELLAGCGSPVDTSLLWPEREVKVAGVADAVLVARIVHISDSHLLDIESPARYAGFDVVVNSAWRPWEAYAPQLLDGIVRATNRIHQSGLTIDFVVHTGDLCDNAQSNELGWALDVMDGRMVEPLSGPDDRPADARPAATLDPHAAFQAQGLYRSGLHGEGPSIPWYAVPGNHDTYALGTFAIVTFPDGARRAPLPISSRPGILAPTLLDPTGCWTHGQVTPARPGLPALLGNPSLVMPNPARAFFDRSEFKRALFGTATEPAGHGFSAAENDTGWYSVSPLPGLRLIGMDTSDRLLTVPALPYDDGCISIGQREFLRRELAAAQARGELIMVASHYPSRSLEQLSEFVVGPADLRNLLNEYPNVVLHLAGHHHVNRVFDRNGYVEIQTCSTLALPQEGRIIEIWRNPADNSVLIGYDMFSHLDDDLPALGDDPLRAMREVARELAKLDKARRALTQMATPQEVEPEGSPGDRRGQILLRR
ncbi:MAG: metallophosphoesterase [Phycisphaerae bacterium]|nr:metallophosphoesterase [Phycisphaerae bacterium]